MNEDEKKIKKDATWVFVLIILVVLLMVGTFSMLGLKEADKCVGNPLVYGAESVKKQGELVCSCFMIDKPTIQFFFNSSGLYQGNVFLS